MAQALRKIAPVEPDLPLGVIDAASVGSRRDLLVALRDRVAAAVENPKTLPRDLAQLTRRLLEIVGELEAIDAGVHGDDVGRAASTGETKWVAS